ncbi:hypothetical protein MMC10_009453 [Thelotrema lepadinum]|nr:hypothetical protein [Thelotrema lepadinum]
MCQEIEYFCLKCKRKWEGLGDDFGNSAKLRRCKKLGKQRLDEISSCEDYNPVPLQKDSRQCPNCKPDTYKDRKASRRKNKWSWRKKEPQADTRERETITHTTRSSPGTPTISEHERQKNQEADQLNAAFANALASATASSKPQNEAPSPSQYHGYQQQQGRYGIPNTPYNTGYQARNNGQGQEHEASRHPQQQQRGHASQNDPSFSQPSAYKDGAFSQGSDHLQSRSIEARSSLAQVGHSSSQNFSSISTPGASAVAPLGGYSSNLHPESPAPQRTAMNRSPASAPQKNAMGYPGDAYSYNPPASSFPKVIAMDYSSTLHPSNRPLNTTSTGWPSMNDMNDMRQAIAEAMPQNNQSSHASSRIQAKGSAFNHPGVQKLPTVSQPRSSGLVAPRSKPLFRGVFGSSSKVTKEVR